MAWRRHAHAGVHQRADLTWSALTTDETAAAAAADDDDDCW